MGIILFLLLAYAVEFYRVTFEMKAISVGKVVFVSQEWIKHFLLIDYLLPKPLVLLLALDFNSSTNSGYLSCANKSKILGAIILSLMSFAKRFETLLSIYLLLHQEHHLWTSVHSPLCCL